MSRTGLSHDAAVSATRVILEEFTFEDADQATVGVRILAVVEAAVGAALEIHQREMMKPHQN